MKATWWLVAIGAFGGCNLDSELPDGDFFSVGGAVHGMWTGAAPVELTLTYETQDIHANVAADGSFVFDTFVPDGVAYTVSVDSPTGLACSIVAGASGTVAGANVSDLDVACTGPAVTMSLSLPISFTFDPTSSTQTIPLSVLAQQVSVTIGGEITSVMVDAAPATVGQPSLARDLALGVNDVTVAVTAGTLSKTYTLSFNRGAQVLAQSGFGKASNTSAGDEFGYSIAVAGDILAVGAPVEASGGDGVDANQSDDSAPSAGAVYVFRRSGATWTQEAYLKASASAANDRFGQALAFDGERLVVGAPRAFFPATATNAIGAAFVFRRIAGTWVEEQILGATNAGGDDMFGSAVAISGDRIAVGAPLEDSNSETAPDETLLSSGAAYVFHRSGTVWTQEKYVKAPNRDADDKFGYRVALSGDTLAVAALHEDSSVTGVQSTASANNAASNSGAVYVYEYGGSTWTFKAFVKQPGTPTPGDNFGGEIALSGDRLVVSAYFEDKPPMNDVGYVYTYARIGGAWTYESTLEASDGEADDFFGLSIALSGELLVVGAPGEDSSAPGVDPNGIDNEAPKSGAAYLFRRTNGEWVRQAYIKPGDPEADDNFGDECALSGDTLVCGATWERSAATGFGGDATDTSALKAGAIYTFR